MIRLIKWLIKVEVLSLLLQLSHSTVTKQRKKRSRAWDFFEEKVDAKGNNKYACRFCGQEYFETKGKSTTQMNSHISKCPRNPYKVEKGQKLLPYQTVPGVIKVILFHRNLIKKSVGWLCVVW